MANFEEKCISDEFSKMVDKIFSYSSFGVKPSLDRIKKLMEHFNSVEKNLKFVHVAGTNGKGSTSTMIADVLTESGYKTGIFTSPHLISFCERIAVDGEMISEKDLVRIGKKVADFADEADEKPTAFDVITAIALLYFAEKKCDVVVLECGLGGRYDATNIVKPVLSVITSVSYDHKGILGNTLKEISEEKAGIIKEEVPVVSYPFESSEAVFNPQERETIATLEKMSHNKHSELIVADSNDITESSSDESGTSITVDGLHLFSSLKGEHQKANMLTAYTAIRRLKTIFTKISDESIIKGFSKAYIPARLEKVQEKPTVIIDGGHNYDCALAVRKFAEEHISAGKKVLVLGMMKDKECDRVLQIIAPVFDKVIITKPEGSRAKDTIELGKLAEKYNPSVITLEDPLIAFSQVLSNCDEKDCVIVFGSFYLAGEIKEKFYK